MALVSREAACLESRIDNNLARDCSTWQQLQIMKRKLYEDKEDKREPVNCEGLTRSERLLWYRNNQPRIEYDNYLCQQSSNYRQLQMARGVRAVAETQEEKSNRFRTKSESLLYYRYQGGEQEIDRQKEQTRLCGTWQQYHMMTRGRAEPRDPDQELTRSEALLWYRNGGREKLEIRDRLARESNNWRQYKLTVDTTVVAGDLEFRMNKNWSQFRNKEELSDYIADMRAEGVEERESIRNQVRNRVSSLAEDTTVKKMYSIHQQPWDLSELEEVSSRKVESVLSHEERVEQLRQVTEEMITARNEYSVSTRALAMKAIKEDSQAVAASRTSRKVTSVVQQQGTVAA